MIKTIENKNNRPTFVGLFSGCGGLDLGFIQEGFECIGAFDLDELAVKNYSQNIGSHVECLDVTKHFNELVSLVSIADVLVAGPPCQGFSTIGKRTLNDPRNSLLTYVAKLAVHAKPSVVVIENVAGVLSPPHDKYWTEAQSRLVKAGYECETIKCAAYQFGLAQSRTRIFMIASLRPSLFPIALPTLPPSSLISVLANLDGLPNHNPVDIPVDSDMYKIATRIKQGQKLSNVRGGTRAVHTWDIPEVFGQVDQRERVLLENIMKIRRKVRSRQFGDADPVSIDSLSGAVGFSCKRTLNNLVRKGYIRQIGDLYDLTNSFNGKFRRLSWTDLAPTVDTRFGQPRYFLHPDQNRGLSVREAARIQGFPDTFAFYGPVQAQFRMIGNAVPPPLARCVASTILKSGFQ